MYDTLINIVDLLILWLILFYILKLLKRTRAIQILFGIILFFILFAAAVLLPLPALSFIFSKLVTIIAVAVLIIFQPEIRRLFERAGNRGWFLPMVGRANREELERILEILVQATEKFARMRMGAIIVWEQDTGLSDYLDTGVEMNVDLSVDFLETLFFPKNPMHDGAVIIRGSKVIAARCYLPLTDNPSLPSIFGTRHRAAIGVTEVSDAIVLVVSEERGEVSIAHHGAIAANLKPVTVRHQLLSIVFPRTAISSKLPVEEEES
jgi:diadenylate cyclase